SIDAAHEEATGALEDAQVHRRALRDELRALEQERSALAARVETHELSLSRKDAVGAVLGAAGELAGVRGSLAALVTITPGFEDAVAAVLGQVADAPVVESLDVAVDVIRWLRTEDDGRSTVLVEGASAPGEHAALP